MKVWLASLTSASRNTYTPELAQGLALMFWDADAVGATIDEVELLPPRTIVGGGEFRVELEPFGVNDVPTFSLQVDLSNPEVPDDFRAMVWSARRLGVVVASGWVKDEDPFAATSGVDFVGIWEPDAPLRLRAGEPVELVFAEVVNHVASELVLPDWGDLSSHPDAFSAPVALLTYLTPQGRVTYWLRDVLAVPLGVLLRSLLEQVVQRANAIMPPGLNFTTVMGWWGEDRFVSAFVDFPEFERRLHEEPEVWRKLEDTLLLVRARAYSGDAGLDFAEYLRECQSLRDFLRRCAEATLSNWKLCSAEINVTRTVGEFALPSGSMAVNCSTCSEAFVDANFSFGSLDDISKAIQSIEVGAYQLRTVRVSAGGRDYVEQVYARRGLEWGATPPFTAGIVPVEEHYYFRNGVAQFTEKVPPTFPLVRAHSESELVFCRRLRVKHYRNNAVHLLSGDYTSDDGFGNARGYRYVYGLTPTELADAKRYVEAVAYKMSSVATLLRCAFPALGGYDFPDGVVRLGTPWRRITTLLEVEVLGPMGIHYLGMTARTSQALGGTVVGVVDDLVLGKTTLKILQHDVAHEPLL